MHYSPALAKSASSVESWRKPVSFVFAAFWVAAVVFTVPAGLCRGWHEAGELVGFLLLMIAALGRIWSLAYIAGRKNQVLCQSGPYSLTRNPLYFFSFVGVIGFSLAVQNIMVGALAALCFLAYYAGVIRREERRLRALHGKEFEAYCANVPRFWPKWKSPEQDAEVRLNMQVFSRGLRETFWLLSTIVLADLIEVAHTSGWIPAYVLPL